MSLAPTATARVSNPFRSIRPQTGDRRDRPRALDRSETSSCDTARTELHPDPARLQSPSPGGVPERPKGTGCKPVGSAYGGSNPPAPTAEGDEPRREAGSWLLGRLRLDGSKSSPTGLLAAFRDRCGEHRRERR